MKMENANEPFKDLLGAYAAPAKDDGFTQMVMAKAQAQSAPVRNTEKTRTAMMTAAALIGGAFAALQIPALIDLAAAINLPTLPNTLSNGLDFSMPLLALGGAGLILGLGWFSAATLWDEKF